METRSKALLYFEHLQEESYKHLGIGISSEDLLRIRTARLETLEETLNVLDGVLPPGEIQQARREFLALLDEDPERAGRTRFEDPFQHAILLDRTRQIEHAAGDLSYTVPGSPIIGTLL